MPGYVEHKEQSVQRQDFNAKASSPLVQHYIDFLSGTQTSRPLSIKWTLPPKDLYATKSSSSKTAYNSFA
eukprot:3401578-Pyramimonas_sp.AAC.1